MWFEVLAILAGFAIGSAIGGVVVAGVLYVLDKYLDGP